MNNTCFESTKRKLLNIVLLYIFLLLVNTSFAQNNLELLDSLLGSEATIQVKKVEIKKLFQKSEKADLPVLTYKAYRFFFYKKEFKEAIHYSLEQVKAIQAIDPFDSAGYRNGLTNVGLFYSFDGQPEQAEDYYNQVLDDPKIDKYRARAMERLGTLSRENGDYYTAMAYFKKARKVYEHISYVRGIVFAAVAIAETYDELKDQNGILKAQQILEELLQSEIAVKFDERNFQEIYHVLGFLYNQDDYNDQQKAIYYCQEALKIATKRDDQYAKPVIQNNLAKVYLKHNPAKAYDYLLKGINSTADDKIKALFLHNLADCYVLLNQPRMAISTMKQSIAKYVGSTIQVESIPLQDLQTSQYKRQLIENYISLIEFENNLASTDLDTVFQHIDTAEKLLEHIRFESNDQNTKLFWQGQGAKLYEQAVKTAYLSSDPGKAFYYMEKNKSLLLLEGISDRILKKNAALPESIVEQERLFKTTIFRLQDQYQKNADQKIQITDSINYYKSAYFNLIDSLKTAYPDYYKYKTLPKVNSISKVQKGLSADKMILEYILNDQEGYGVCISKEHINFFKIEDAKQLNTNIIELKKYLSSPILLKQQLLNYSQLAFQVYETLFPANVFNKSALVGKKLTIIPDHNLQNLPFDVLVKDPGLKLKDAYLINDVEFNYAYSISLLSENEKIDRKEKPVSVSGFAPVNFYNENLSELKRSRAEIESITQILSGESFLNTEASKRNFLEVANQSLIVHLATHADASDSIAPAIAFAKSNLTLNEVYLSTVNAELVMLSACNSALGKVKKGEGVMSLARGFFLAGANSVISSLWNVDDRSGQEITTSFYKYLKANHTRSSALRLAKLDYLNQHGLSDSSPFYWSSLVLIGSPNSIEFSANNNFWLIISFILSLVVVVIISLKIRRLLPDNKKMSILD